MPRGLNTVIIVPHNRTRSYKFTFTTRSFYLALLGLFVLVGLAAAALVLGGSAGKRMAALASLKRENQELKKVNAKLEETIREVQRQLDLFEERTARLALAAGLDPDQILSLGNGEQAEVSGGPYDRIEDAPELLIKRGERLGRSLAVVEEKIDRRLLQLSCTPTVAPVRGILTDGFGPRKDPFTGRRAMHRGLDISARIGTPVKAPADGVVISAGRERGFGKTVRLSHGFGFETVYGHLHKILVKPGDRVKRGDVLGLVGNTGRSTGPHLHYEVHKDGRAVNPLYYILDWQ